MVIAVTLLLRLPSASAQRPQRDSPVFRSEIALVSLNVAVKGRANEPLTFLWRRRVDDQRAGQPLRLRGSVVSLVGLGELHAADPAVQIEVQQGLARSIARRPAGVAINRSGPLVGLGCTERRRPARRSSNRSAQPRASP
jgi:hypothetical protein